MTDSAEFWKRLAAPFPAEDIQWRVGSTTRDKKKGLALAYFDARAVMERLDEVCGKDGWSDHYIIEGKSVLCQLSIHVPGSPPGVMLRRSDGADMTDIEATKGGISDAFKRAFVKFGCRYLYQLPALWVPIKEQGRSYVIAEPPRLPAWALPGGSGRPAPSEDAAGGSQRLSPVEPPASEGALTPPGAPGAPVSDVLPAEDVDSLRKRLRAAANMEALSGLWLKVVQPLQEQGRLRKDDYEQLKQTTNTRKEAMSR